MDAESAREVVGKLDHQEMEEIMAEHELFKRIGMKKTMLDLGSTEQLPIWESVEKLSLQQHTVPGGGTPIGELERDEELAVLYPELENLELAANYIDIDEIRGTFIRD